MWDQFIQHMPSMLWSLLLHILIALLSNTFIAFIFFQGDGARGTFIQWFRRSTRTKNITPESFERLEAMIRDMPPVPEVQRQSLEVLHMQQEQLQQLNLAVMKLLHDQKHDVETPLNFPKIMIHHGDRFYHDVEEADRIPESHDIFMKDIQKVTYITSRRLALYIFLRTSASEAVLKCDDRCLPCLVQQLRNIIQTFYMGAWPGTNTLQADVGIRPSEGALMLIEQGRRA